MTSFRWYLQHHKPRVKKQTAQYALGLVVLELDVQAVLDADLHLDRVVAVGRHPIRVYPHILLLGDVCYPPRDCNPDKVPGIQDT